MFLYVFCILCFCWCILFHFHCRYFFKLAALHCYVFQFFVLRCFCFVLLLMIVELWVLLCFIPPTHLLIVIFFLKINFLNVKTNLNCYLFYFYRCCCFYSHSMFSVFICCKYFQIVDVFCLGYFVVDVFLFHWDKWHMNSCLIADYHVFCPAIIPQIFCVYHIYLFIFLPVSFTSICLP